MLVVMVGVCHRERVATFEITENEILVKLANNIGQKGLQYFQGLLSKSVNLIDNCLNLARGWIEKFDSIFKK